ncbi:hypothetical protein LCGC14_1717400 [marine sediment metagenome]|uniref:VRR-NUC domain-containing protein n=1 Tax=marine sediment metagenome TaxID=412755 RepID=A0A0F9HDP2_9ZZZZ
MTRKGYASELRAKEELIKEFGSDNVIKVAIGGAQDFIIVQKGKLLKVVEVKECHQKKYYPQPREKGQRVRMIAFCLEHGASLEIWIRYPQRQEWSKEVVLL